MTVICLGEALIDLVPPPSLSPRTADFLTVQPGGAPLNIAIGLARLGTDSLLLGCLSSDGFGQRLADLLTAEGVPRVPTTPVEQSTRLAVVDHLNPASPFRFYGDATADTMLSADDVEAAFDAISVEGLYVGSLMMTDPRSRTVQEFALDEAARRSIPVFSDPNPRPAAWPVRADMGAATELLLSRSAIAKLSLDDALALGWPDRSEALLRWCRRRFPAQMFVTGGPAGCWTLLDGAVVHASAPLLDTIDPTGAGDASFAALIARYLATGTLGETELRYAAAAGALATQKRGAISGLPTMTGLQASIDALDQK